MSDYPEVVITGVGVVCPIGIGGEAMHESMTGRQSGVTPTPHLEEMTGPLSICASVSNFDGRKLIKPRKSLKVMCKPIQLGAAAASLALTDSGIDIGSVESHRIGTVIGGELYYGDPADLEAAYRACLVDSLFDSGAWAEEFMKNINPLFMLKYLPNMVASHVAIAANAQGPCNTIIQEEASSLLAIIEAADLIKRGWADVVLAGGSGSRISPASLAYRGELGLTKKTRDPEKAPAPFAANRDGTVQGEGAGIITLESREHAEKRGAPIYATLQGYGRTFGKTANDTTSSGIVRSIEMALQNSHLNADQIGHVSANAGGWTDRDQHEAEAIREVLGDVPVTALKSYFGNLGAGVGSVELIGNLLGLKHGTIHPTINVAEVDPRCPVNLVTQSTDTDASKNNLLCLSQAITGQHVAVVLVG